MAYIETTKDGIKYVEVDGRMSRVRYRESCGEKGKPFVSFSVCYHFGKNEFDENVSFYLNCVAFGKRAELVNWLNEQNKLSVLVRGELTESEYNGETQEQLICSWVQSEQEIEIPKEKQTTKKADNSDWGESETEFSD